MIIYHKDIFGKMSEMIGVDFKTIDINKKGWYDDHTWTRQQEKEFKQWLTEYFKKSKGAFWFFRDINVYPHNRTQCKLLAEKLTNQYGWRVNG